MLHLVSARTGRPVAVPWTLCAVRHRSALEVDGWATALFAGGEEAPELARREGIAAFWLEPSGEQHIGSDF